MGPAWPRLRVGQPRKIPASLRSSRKTKERRRCFTSTQAKARRSPPGEPDIRFRRANTKSREGHEPLTWNPRKVKPGAGQGFAFLEANGRIKSWETRTGQRS